MITTSSIRSGRWRSGRGAWCNSTMTDLIDHCLGQYWRKAKVAPHAHVSSVIVKERRRRLSCEWPSRPRSEDGSIGWLRVFDPAACGGFEINA
jgi:hypothetical protein